MRDFEIYFSDLTVGAQDRLMRAVGITEPKEMNWDLDIVPIALYPISSHGDDIFFRSDLFRNVGCL